MRWIVQRPGGGQRGGPAAVKHTGGMVVFKWRFAYSGSTRWISGDIRVIRGVSSYAGGMWSLIHGLVRVPITGSPELDVN